MMKGSFIKRRGSRGMTLVELMVVVVVIGILGAIAYPAFQAYGISATRADAKVALWKEAGRLEEFYLNSDTYNGAAVSSATSPEGYYSIAVSGGTAFVYLLTATRIDTTADPECLTLTLNQLGEEKSSGSATAADCWSK